MPHPAVRFCAHPLVIKASMRTLRRRLQHHFATSRRHRRQQSRQRRLRIASPPRHLRAVQVLHRQPASRVRIARRLHPVLAVQLRKYQRPRICPRSLQCSLPQLLRQQIVEPSHHAKDLLRRLLRVRHLHAQRPRLRHRLQEKTSRHPGADAHLPRLQHNVGASPTPLKLLLRPVRPERCERPLARPHLQQSLRQKGSRSLPTQSLRRFI